MNLGKMYLTTKLMILVGLLAAFAIYILQMPPLTILVYTVAALVPLYLISTVGGSAPVKAAVPGGMATPVKGQGKTLELLQKRASEGDVDAAREYARLKEELQRQELADRVLKAGTSPDGYAMF